LPDRRDDLDRLLALAALKEQRTEIRGQRSEEQTL
jgi:hypothetical protein